MINHKVTTIIKIQNPTLIEFSGYSLKDFKGKQNVTIFMEYLEKDILSDYLKSTQIGDDTAIRQIFFSEEFHMECLFFIKNYILYRYIIKNDDLFDSNFKLHIIEISKLYEKGKPQSSIAQNDTAIYMTPEAINDNMYNAKNDVYSFSIIMYEIATGQISYPYFQECNMAEYLFKQKVGGQNHRPSFTNQIKQLI